MTTDQIAILQATRAMIDSLGNLEFAGIWVSQWESVRKVKEGLVTTDLFGFLTADPNGIVGPIHYKAMPVVLRPGDEVEIWLSAPWEEAKHLQRPLPDAELTVLTMCRQDSLRARSSMKPASNTDPNRDKEKAPPWGKSGAQSRRP